MILHPKYPYAMPPRYLPSIKSKAFYHSSKVLLLFLLRAAAAAASDAVAVALPIDREQVGKASQEQILSLY